MTAPNAYPLSWPLGWPRTPASKRSDPQFRSVTTRISEAGQAKRLSGEIRLSDARDRIQEQLDKLGARNAVLSTNLELRLDGLPRAGLPEPADPGVACYFQLRGRPIVLACDRWNTVAGNVAAIAAHINAMRGMDRWGVGSVEQLFTGYAALPAPMVPDDWRTVLNNPLTLSQAEEFYRAAMMTAHPDRGGSHARAAALNAAIDKARKELRA